MLTLYAFKLYNINRRETFTFLGGVNMKSFLDKVIKATNELGEAPYDDEKVTKNLLEATRKTVDYCNKLREIKVSK